MLVQELLVHRRLDDEVDVGVLIAKVFNEIVQSQFHFLVVHFFKQQHVSRWPFPLEDALAARRQERRRESRSFCSVTRCARCMLWKQCHAHLGR